MSKKEIIEAISTLTALASTLDVLNKSQELDVVIKKIVKLVDQL